MFLLRSELVRRQDGEVSSVEALSSGFTIKVGKGAVTDNDSAGGVGAIEVLGVDTWVVVVGGGGKLTAGVGLGDDFSPNSE